MNSGRVSSAQWWKMGITLVGGACLFIVCDGILRGGLSGATPDIISLSSAKKALAVLHRQCIVGPRQCWSLLDRQCIVGPRQWYGHVGSRTYPCREQRGVACEARAPSWSGVASSALGSWLGDTGLPAFVTPLGASGLGARLAEECLAMEQRDPGRFSSNNGGWQGKDLTVSRTKSVHAGCVRGPFGMRLRSVRDRFGFCSGAKY